VALSTSTLLMPGTEVTIQFTLTNHLAVTADCKVCWHNDKGQSGLLFLFLSSNLCSELQAWLARRLEEQLPDPVTKSSSYRQTTDCEAFTPSGEAAEKKDKLTCPSRGG